MAQESSRDIATGLERGIKDSFTLAPQRKSASDTVSRWKDQARDLVNRAETAARGYVNRMTGSVQAASRKSSSRSKGRR